MRKMSLAFGITMLLASCSTTTSVSELAEIQGEWQLQRFQIGDGGEVRVPDPSKYTARFNPGDGTASFRADCNSCRATYTTNGTSLNIGPLACTLAQCPPGSLFDDYIRALSRAESFRRASTWLAIDAGGEELVFFLE